MRTVKFNPFDVAKQGKPKKAFETISSWANKGKWCAMESHPEIADADGVPGIDLVVDHQPQFPESENWVLAGSQYLDLPSGKLKVAYEVEFFEDWYADEFPAYEVSSPEMEGFHIDEFVHSTNYLISFEPGLYKLNAYMLDYPSKTGDGRHADLVIVLTSAKNMKSKSAKPLICYAGS
ncbi:MAG: hypothetical protein AAF623_15735 [Planctomycetota bacterium]